MIKVLESKNRKKKTADANRDRVTLHTPYPQRWQPIKIHTIHELIYWILSRERAHHDPDKFQSYTLAESGRSKTKKTKKT